jgi:hypothetical protein
MSQRIYTTIIVAAISTGFLDGCSRARMKVTASPQDVDPGDIVRVSGPLERISSARAQLRYQFNAAAGSFSAGYAESTPAALWMAPSEPGTYLLSVGVLDGESTIARGQASVTVRSGARRKLNVEYEAPPEVTWGGAFSERKTILDQLWRENPHTPDTCTRIVCEALTESCRITWASPPGNFGEAPGHDLSWASKLTFWARGHYGVEEIWASAGADPVGQFPSTLSLTPDPKSGRGMLKLTSDWRQYTIPVPANLTNLPVLFDVLIPPAGGAPVIIYLDDINYEQ